MFFCRHMRRKCTRFLNASSCSFIVDKELNCVGVMLHLSISLWLYRPFCWTSAAFSLSWSFTQSVGLLGRGISPSQGRYLHIGQHKHRINAHTDIHASSGIRTRDPSVWAGEDGSCLRPRSHRDRPWRYIEQGLQFLRQGRLMEVSFFKILHQVQLWYGTLLNLIRIKLTHGKVWRLTRIGVPRVHSHWTSWPQLSIRSCIGYAPFTPGSGRTWSSLHYVWTCLKGVQTILCRRQLCGCAILRKKYGSLLKMTPLFTLKEMS
jgi:hypothetical protein